MKTQDTVVKKSRFQIDKLEDRIAPTGLAQVAAVGALNATTATPSGSATVVAQATATSLTTTPISADITDGSAILQAQSI